MEFSDFTGMTITVTGSSGFVGQSLVKRLHEKGYQVTELDFAKGVDLTDWNQVKSITGMNCLIHLAGKTFVPDSYENPGDFFRTNILCLINALELCRLHKAKMVFASSYVYGIPAYLPIDEAHPVSAFNPYAATKLIGEQICRDYHKHFGIRIVILRPFNIYGPGQDKRFLIPSIIAQAEKGRITLRDPVPKRDFVYIDDVTDAYMHTLLYDGSEFQTFNIASGLSYSVRQICDLVTRLYDKPIEVHFSCEKRPNEINDIIGDYNKAKELLSWEPTSDITKGLKRIVERRACIYD